MRGSVCCWAERGKKVGGCGLGHRAETLGQVAKGDGRGAGQPGLGRGRGGRGGARPSGQEREGRGFASFFFF